MSLRVHGIKSCDTCRKARKWLTAEGLEYQWVDLRDPAPSRDDVKCWLEALGADALVNRRSATWRGLDQAQRPELESPAMIDLLVEHPTLIKRPLFEREGEFRNGFGDAQRQWLRQE